MLSSNAAVYSPQTLDDALALRAAHPEAVPLAGGTDLMVALEMGAINPGSILNLWSVRELATISGEPDQGVRIGALVTYTDLIEDQRVQTVAPTLVEASKTVGARQIQNRGTLAGNIANASPAGDTLPVLLALDAEVEVASAARGHRRIPMSQLYVGYRALSMAADELITAVHLPPVNSADHHHFRKVGTRLAQSISKVMLGARVRVEKGVVTEARIAFGSVAATPVRVPTLEAALMGGPVDPSVVDLLDQAITPIDDVRSSAQYRMAVAKRTLRSFLKSI